MRGRILLLGYVETELSNLGGTEPTACGLEMELMGVAVVGAKNEAFFPGRVPHVRPSVHGPKKMGAGPPNAFARRRKDCGQEQGSLRME
jgi:hypothetical protein